MEFHLTSGLPHKLTSPCFCSMSADEDDRLFPSSYQSLNQSGSIFNSVVEALEVEKGRGQKSKGGCNHQSRRLYPSSIQAPL